MQERPTKSTREERQEGRNYGESTSSATTNSWLFHRLAGTQDGANDLLRKMRTLGLHQRLCDLCLFLDFSACRSNSHLRSRPGFRNGFGLFVKNLLTQTFHALENRNASIVKLLLVFSGLLLGCCNVGLGLLHRPDGLAASFSERTGKRVVNDYPIQNPNENKEDDGRDCSERKFA